MQQLVPNSKRLLRPLFHPDVSSQLQVFRRPLEVEVVLVRAYVVSKSKLVVTQEAEVVTHDNDVVMQEAQVVGLNEEVACGGVECNLPDCMELNCEYAIDENTKKAFRKFNIQNHDDKETIESAPGSDSDSTTTANAKMANHCKRIGRIGPTPSRKGPTTEKRKNVVFDLSIPEPIKSVSHKVCLFDY